MTLANRGPRRHPAHERLNARDRGLNYGNRPAAQSEVRRLPSPEIVASNPSRHPTRFHLTALEAPGHDRQVPGHMSATPSCNQHRKEFSYGAYRSTSSSNSCHPGSLG